jgi:hypothetical protein
MSARRVAVSEECDYEELCEHLREILGNLHCSTHKCCACGWIGHVENDWGACADCGRRLCGTCVGEALAGPQTGTDDGQEVVCEGCATDGDDGQEVVCEGCATDGDERPAARAAGAAKLDVEDSPSNGLVV